ncbi:MAG TPA: bifunctional metallophosphatase/5'-nucleotidase [Usitatibacter sp.]|nr:bifunctional metallophosphatase/5'-nucleotidase [Usitatibacter sp.]
MALRLSHLVVAAALASCAGSSPAPTTVELRLVAFNDFHGHLEAAATLAGAIRALRAGHANSAVVAAGDLVGASPLPSALFMDEPTVDALSQAGLEVSSAGNHEFDHGRARLLRLQTEARFHWLAANVFDEATGKPFLPSFEIREYGAVRVAFVGAVLRSTPQAVVASGVEGLEFRDEAASVNSLIPEIRAKGASAIVLLIHQGGHLPGPYDDPACPGFDGPIVDIVRRLDPAVDIVVSGHTHEAYACTLGGRPVVSAAAHGKMLAAIDLTIDAAAHRVTSSHTELVLVDPRHFAPDPGVEAYVARIDARAAPRAGRVVGVVAGDLDTLPNAAGQSRLGQFVADAQLDAMREAGAQVAFVNAGGLRAPLRGRPPDGRVTFGDLFASQPFGNFLVAITLTGTQVSQLLEEQFRGRSIAERPRALAVSRGFEYAWDGSRRPGHRIVAGSIRLEGRKITPHGLYRVVVNNFLVDGGESYSVFRTGVNRVDGPLDVEALERRVASNAKLPADTPERVIRVDAGAARRRGVSPP